MVLSRMSFSAVNIGSFYESSKIFAKKLQYMLQFSLIWACSSGGTGPNGSKNFCVRLYTSETPVQETG